MAISEEVMAISEEEHSSGCVNSRFGVMEFIRNGHLSRIRISNKSAGIVRIYHIKNCTTGVVRTLDVEIYKGESVELCMDFTAQESASDE